MTRFWNALLDWIVRLRWPFVFDDGPDLWLMVNKNVERELKTIETWRGYHDT